jgi:phosphatidyl-myo-inositol alpha-mannosyltransferase
VKIALVSPYDYPYPGGVTEHVRNLAEQFRTRGHEVDVIAPSSADPASLQAMPWVHPIGRVVPIPTNGSVARLNLPMQGYLQVKRLLAYQAFDIVHLHEPMMPSLPLTVLRHSQAINIGTFHASGRTNLRYFYAKPMLKPQFGKLHGRIAVSRAARDFVARRFPGAYRIIPNGIDYARFATPLEPIPELEDDRLDVLFVGRLEKRKGLQYLLRAWPLVRRQFPKARLLVVGGGGRRLESYRRYVRRQGWPDVLFAGHVSATDLVRYYQTADVFCAPSTGQESFGIVLLEAMAAARPIVASNIPGYAEVVTSGREGLLVRPKDPAALAAGLAELLADAELRRELGARGRDKAAAYDWTKVADRVLDYYHETIDAQMEPAEARRVRFGRVRRAASGVAHILAR